MRKIRMELMRPYLCVTGSVCVGDLVIAGSFTRACLAFYGMEHGPATDYVFFELTNCRI